MTTLRAFLAWLGLAAPLLDSGFCVCGHPSTGAHPAGGACATCGPEHCDAYLPIRVTDADVPYYVRCAWVHAIHGRTLARDQAAFDAQRRGGLELLVHVVAAHALEQRSDIVARVGFLDDIARIGLPAWLITAHALGQQRAITRELDRLTPGEQRHLAVDLLRYAIPQGVAR